MLPKRLFVNEMLTIGWKAAYENYLPGFNLPI